MAPSQGASRSALVLVLERCCLEKRRVNPIRSAFPELHPRSGLAVLKGRKTNRCRTRLQHGARTGFFRPFRAGRHLEGTWG